MSLKSLTHSVQEKDPFIFYQGSASDRGEYLSYSSAKHMFKSSTMTSPVKVIWAGYSAAKPITNLL